MQIEQPHHPPNSLSEFLRQYAMIVLSILTALLLEHAAVSFEHRTAAATSRTRIESELARNAEDLKDAERTNKENIKRAKQILDKLVDHLKAGEAIDDETEKQLEPLFAHLAILMPSLQRSAWEASIADQSASHLNASDLRRYSEIYAASADAVATWQVLLGGEWLTHSIELLLDYRLNKIDQRNLANLLGRYLLTDEQIEVSQEALSDLIAGRQETAAKPAPTAN